MKVPLFKPYVNPEVISDLERIFKSGWIGLGPETEKFEEAFCEYTGSKYAVAVNSCTAALHLSLVCAGIGAGDLVITTPMTFVSTSEAILYQNAIPIFRDVLPHTLSLDPDCVELKLKSLNAKLMRAKAIIVVHYGGNPAEISEFIRIMEDYNVAIIWDCAHAIGASYRGNKIGSFERFACFSFHAVKNLGIGDGGILATNDHEIYNRAKKLRWMGVDSSTYERSSGGQYKWNYSVSELGYKYHMNDVSAVIARAQLKNLDEQNRLRRKWAHYYQIKLSDLWTSKGLIEIMNSNDVTDRVSAQHLFVIKVKGGNRDKLHDYLREKGITTGVHYYPNNHYDMFFNDGTCFFSDKAFEEILSLPMYWQMTDEEHDYVCETIKSYFSHKR